MIESSRLLLRPFTKNDKIDFFKYRSQPDVAKYQSWRPTSLADVDLFFADLPSEFDLPSTWFQLGIFLNGDETLIGDLGVHFTGTQNLQCELGCTIGPKYQNKGYATEAMRMVIYHLFSKYNKHRIFASIDPDNVASIKLIEKLKFRKEAHHIQSYYNKGRWTDDLIYAILQKEWNPNEL